MTAFCVGKFGIIPSLEDLRINQLRRLGFNFDNSLPEASNNELYAHLLDETKGEHSWRRVSFKSGILFSCEFPKDDVLRSYLSFSKIKPKKLVFIDDKLNNLKIVERYCKNNNIEFIGFEYVYAEKHNSKEFDFAQASLQLDILEYGKVWLDDAKMSKILMSYMNIISNINNGVICFVTLA